VRVSRFWLVLLYVLATAMAQCVHDHGQDDEGAAAQHESGCADPRPHISGHWSPDLDDHRDDCLACQFRAEHQSDLSAETTFVVLSVADAVEVSSPAPPQRFFLRNTCRAPPSRDAA
jgi:hypothetical protein